MLFIRLIFIDPARQPDKLLTVKAEEQRAREHPSGCLQSQLQMGAPSVGLILLPKASYMAKPEVSGEVCSSLVGGIAGSYGKGQGWRVRVWAIYAPHHSPSFLETMWWNLLPLPSPPCRWCRKAWNLLPPPSIPVSCPQSHALTQHRIHPANCSHLQRKSVPHQMVFSLSKALPGNVSF